MAQIKFAKCLQSMINVLTIVFMQWPFPWYSSVLIEILDAHIHAKQHMCTQNQMKNTQKSLFVLVITSILHVCSNFRWFVPYTPYIANCSRWKSFVIAEMNCNSLQNFCSCIVVLCIIQYKDIITNSLEKFLVYQSIRENSETFPPWPIFNIWYH